jgi:hypothetical protein
MPAGKTIILSSVLLLLVALYLYSLPGRIPDIDDAWIGEHAYWLATEGHAKSELMRGITEQEDYLIVHHKLLTLQGALFINLFGFSLYSLKSISLIYFILFLILFYIYVKKIAMIFNKNDWLLSMIILFAFPWTFKYSFLYRPEIPVMTLGFISFILLQRYRPFLKYPVISALLAGMLSGLAVVTHLNGLVIAGAGFLFLLAEKRWGPAWLFVAGALLMLPIYFYDFNQTYGFQFWLFQMTESPALDSVPDAPLVLQPILNLVEEHRRYFHNPRIIIFTAFIFTAIGFSFRYLKEKHKQLLVYAALSMLLMALIGVHKSRQYILLFFPYLLILATLSLKRIFQVPEGEISGHKRIRFITSFSLLFIFVAGSSVYNIMHASEKFVTSQNRELSLKYFGKKTGTANIVAPMTFVFNEIEYYNRIQGEVCYTELQKQDSSIYGNGFLKKASSFDIDHIILTPYYSKLLGVEKWQTGDQKAGYTVLDNIDGGVVLTRSK